MESVQTTGWLSVGGHDAAFVCLHAPERPVGPAAVIVPPFGWDEMCSYRARRALAIGMAEDGVTALRLDLPGTGDSAGGPWDPDRLGAWIAAVAAAAGHLRAGGATRVSAVGFGLGALVACRAAELGAAIDDLALWGVPATGRAMVRELKAFGRLEIGLGPDAALPAGTVSAAGFVLSPETASALTTVDLRRITLGSAAGRRVRLLDRDGLGVDEAVVASLRATGAAVQLAAGSGWGRMLDEPQYSKEPVAVLTALRAWAAADLRPSMLPAGPGAELLAELDLGAVKERPIVIPGPRGGLPGVLSVPADAAADRMGVLLNAGPQRRTGPNRLWVETARRWAASGVATLRVDLGGIGDASPDLELADVGVLYTGDHVTEARAVLAALRRLGGRRFVVVGLCSGAYWGLHAAVEEPDVRAAVLLNPRALVWERRSVELRDARLFVRQLRQATSWQKVLQRRVNWGRPARLARAVALEVLGLPLRRLRRRSVAATVPADPVRALLDRLPARGDRIVIVFSGAEELEAELIAGGSLERLKASPNASVNRLGDAALDTHTLRPTVLQRELAALLDSELELALGGAAGAGGVPSV